MAETMRVRVLDGPIVLGHVMAQTGDVLDVLPPYAETVMRERPGCIEEVREHEGAKAAKAEEKPAKADKPLSARERKALLDAAPVGYPRAARGPESWEAKPIGDTTPVVEGDSVRHTEADIFATTSTVAGSPVHAKPGPAPKAADAVKMDAPAKPVYAVKGENVVKAAPAGKQ